MRSDLLPFDHPGGNFLLWALTLTALGLIATGFVMAVLENGEWETFKVDHHCKVVAKIPGEVIATFGADPGNGMPTVGVATTSSRTGWLCDDGITYYR